MNRFDILVHPARNESFGRVLVEAMAAGRPVIAVNDGGTRETLDNGAAGILVPPDDPTALAEAIRRLLHDRTAARRMSEGGRERAMDYSAERMATAYADVYAEMLARARHTDPVVLSPSA